MWIAVPSDRPGKLDKLPVDWRNGDVCDAQNPANWCAFDTAAAIAPGYDRGWGSGVGFVITEADPYFFLDADSVLEADGQTWAPIVHEMCRRLPGAAVEVSQSGKGLHWFGRYTSVPEHGTKNLAARLELYTKGRFVALTGTHARGDVESDHTAALAAICAEWFPPTVTGPAVGWSTEPVPEWSGPEDDEELLRRALSAGRNSAAAQFGDAVTFADLWEARVDRLAVKWPDPNRPYDASNADQAFANHLAFWTGKNCERMERMMRRSALARPKWDEHRTYLADTILKACAYVGKVASSPASAATGAPPSGPTVPAVEGGRDPTHEYMVPTQQLDHFAGCHFVTGLQKIFSLSRNEVLEQTSFDVLYGGHMFVVDPQGRKTTDSAWNAFTKSRCYVPSVVSGLCFRPELEPGARVTIGGKVYVNSYVPYDCPTAEGDVGPFLGFLAKLLPVEADRAILLAYLAALTQFPGRKLQWWPVLQGTQGNGKTLILTAMTYIIGEHYTHLPNAHAMARNGLQFNSWIERKLFIGIEEISLSNKRDFLDEFKPVVTNLRIASEGKGSNQTNTDNRANGILCTNHPDGVPVSADERRYAIFYTAQQGEEDLARDGMGGSYFPDLYDWLHGRGAYQGRDPGLMIIAGYLRGYAIPEALNPVTVLTRAPKTSSTGAAVVASLGRAEQEVMEAIEEGRIGFAGGFVSSRYLDELLDRVRAPVPRNKRRDMMRRLGYEWHPALINGRVNEVVLPDMGKPKLYVRRDHVAMQLGTAGEVAKAYSRAQQPQVANDVSPAARAFG